MSIYSMLDYRFRKNNFLQKFLSCFGCLCWQQGSARWPPWEESGIALCQRAGSNGPITGHRCTHQPNWCTHQPNWCSGKANLRAANVAQREEEQGTKRVRISRVNTKVRRRSKRTKMRYSMVEQIATLQPVGRRMAEKMGVFWRSCGKECTLKQGKTVRGKEYQTETFTLPCPLNVFQFLSNFMILE